MKTLSLIETNPLAIKPIQPAPFVQLIHAFQPKTQPKRLLEEQLKTVELQIEKALMNEYRLSEAIPCLHRLRTVLQELNYHTHKNSIAIFINADQEKVLYLDMEVDNRFSIHSQHNGADLALSRKQEPRYLVLVLEENWSQTYFGSGTSLQLIKNNIGDEFTATKDFLQHMEYGLSVLIRAYPYPVFLAGKPSLLQTFLELTRHSAAVAACIETDNLVDPMDALISPYLSDWSAILRKVALARMDQGMLSGAVKTGLVQVERYAGRRHGQLLLCETTAEDIPTGNQRLPFYAPNTIDAITFKVLETGGEVLFLAAGTLMQHGGIALVNPC
jgi:hypothetical protein